MTETPEDHEQLPLFSVEGEPPAPSGGRSKPSLLASSSSLGVAQGAFEAYMVSRGFTENTQQAFRLDMELLEEYLGAGTPLGQISTANLNAFLNWMTDSRGVPCSPKTLERRITTLKVFFGWLAEEGVIDRDPAAPLIHRSVSAPLPEILNDEQVEAVLVATEALRRGAGDHKPDPRPHLLVTLILHTGIKKGESVGIALNHIDLTQPARPMLWIRYRRPSRRHKERRIALPTWWTTVLREYLQVYEPEQLLFPWTARNLEYQLDKVAREAEVPRLTFEMLRWTCAARDYAEGMDPEALRQKLGLSEITWYEVEVKLALLAQRIHKV